MSFEEFNSTWRPSVNFDAMMAVVRKLSNQAWVRYFLWARSGHFILSVMQFDGRAARVLESDMNKAGFFRLDDTSIPGEVWIARRED